MGALPGALPPGPGGGAPGHRPGPGHPRPSTRVPDGFGGVGGLGGVGVGGVGGSGGWGGRNKEVPGEPRARRGHCMNGRGHVAYPVASLIQYRGPGVQGLISKGLPAACEIWIELRHLNVDKMTQVRD